jgi:hypothetical protein
MVLVPEGQRDSSQARSACREKAIGRRFRLVPTIPKTAEDDDDDEDEKDSEMTPNTYKCLAPILGSGSPFAEAYFVPTPISA